VVVEVGPETAVDSASWQWWRVSGRVSGRVVGGQAGLIAALVLLGEQGTDPHLQAE